MKEYKICQSCTMPMKKLENRGTERNHEKSVMYCKNCYEEGEFTQKDITVAEMKQLVKDKCIEMGFPKFLANMFVKKMDKLERWKKK